MPPYQDEICRKAVDSTYEADGDCVSTIADLITQNGGTALAVPPVYVNISLPHLARCRTSTDVENPATLSRRSWF